MGIGPRYRRAIITRTIIILHLACSYPSPYVPEADDTTTSDTGIDIVTAVDILREQETVQARCYAIRHDGTRGLIETGIEWSTGDPLVLDMAPSGLIRGLAAGSADIHAKSGVFTASRRITVTPAPDYSDILIGEVYYEPATSAEAEFIEIWNSGNEIADISGFWMVDSGTSTPRYYFPAGTLLSGGGRIIIARKNEAFLAEFGFSPGSPESGITLGNYGETVILNQPDGSCRDMVYLEGGDGTYVPPVSWGDPLLPSAIKGSSASRISHFDTDSCSDWMAGTPTPGY